MTRLVHSARLVRSTARGTLHVVGWRDETMHAAAELATRYAEEGRFGIERVEIADEDAVLKSSAMHGKSAIRWGIKRALFRARLPRVNEYYNLSWLTERLFSTPLPLAAGALVRNGIPRWQFLVTRFVKDGTTLHDWFASSPSATERAAVLNEIAREVARMHALRFVHRDLWTRNLLVVPPGGQSRVVFLDAWAGGVGAGGASFGLRGRSHDLRCFQHDMRNLWSDAESGAWRANYAADFAAVH